MSKYKKTFLILDGNALLHRAWHAIPPLTTKDGRVVNAAYGFTMVVENMREQLKPDYMAVAWDLPGGTFRNDLYEAYKATREKKEDELYEQIDVIQGILETYGIPSLSVVGFEADDVIGTIAHKYGKKKDTRVMIVTGDLDALQLVDDKEVEVVFFQKGISQTKTYDEAAVMDRYGLRPDQLIDLKALMGDSSDNIPGIAGVGQKTATTLLQEHGTIEGIYEAIERGDVPEKFARKFEGQEEEVEKMKRLVTIVRDVDLEGFRITDAKVGEPEVPALVEQLRDLEFRNLLKKYGDATRTDQVTDRGGSKNKNTPYVDLEKLDTTEFCIYLARGQADLFGASGASLILSDGTHTSHPLGLPLQKEEDRSSLLVLLNSAKSIVGHDLKAVMHALNWEPKETELFDTMVAAYLLDSGARQFDLESVAHQYLNAGVLPTNTTDVILRLATVLGKELKEQSLSKIASEIEMPLIPVLYRMERSGIAVDTKHLDVLSAQFEKELASLTKKIYKLAGREFNINSPAQLSEILFEDLGLPTKKIKKTKTSYSTAASELEKLWEAHEIIPLISQYREIAKLKSTYVDALPVLVADDGRIHTTYNQTVAATGRLSSSDPNLQNIPTRTPLGNEIRKAFVAPPGRCLVAMDYSQFELRLAAVFAKDKAFINAFNEGADIHRRVAAQILDKSEKEVTKQERSAAKAINFGILYGMGQRNLARSSGLSQEEAKEFLARYFDLHPGIADYIEEMKRLAHKNEYVETLFGRRRYLPEINSGVGMLAAAAERMAVNMPVQGTQADLLKMAMLEVAAFTKDRDDVQMLLQVHDELVFEMDIDAVDTLVPKIQQMMEKVWKTDVPLVVNVEVGTNWGEMQEQAT